MRVLSTYRFLALVIVLAGAGAAAAVNVGPDDAQISFTGAPGSVATDAVLPAAAFEAVSQRYLVVWAADDPDGDFHIYGQLLTGLEGAPLGAPFRISPLEAAGTDHNQPALAVDEARGRFLVVWSSDGQSPGAYEIRSQLVGSDGSLIGAPQRLSDMGADDADPAFDAVTPDVAWHPDLDAFVVVWAGDDDTGQLTDGRFELYGQLVAASAGTETGANDFRISFAGPDAAGNDALAPAVAVQPGTERWFVAFEGDIVDDGVHDSEIFMYGASGDVPDPFGSLISEMGNGFSDRLSGRHPDLAWVPSTGELVCVWDGTDAIGTPRAIYGRRMHTDGTQLGAELAISGSTAPGSGELRESLHPAIVIDPLVDEWFVAWQGDLDDGLIHHDPEVWAARFDLYGDPVVPQAFALSAMDPLLGPVAGAGRPALAINTVLGSKLVAWSGDRDTNPGDRDIFVQAWADYSVTGVEDQPRAVAFALHGAAPNPFNPVTKIAFDLPADAPVTLRVYDAAGRLVRTLLAQAPGRAGRNEVAWDGRDDGGRAAASGVYMYRLESPGHAARGRMTLIK